MNGRTNERVRTVNGDLQLGFDASDSVYRGSAPEDGSIVPPHDRQCVGPGVRPVRHRPQASLSPAERRPTRHGDVIGRRRHHHVAAVQLDFRRRRSAETDAAQTPGDPLDVNDPAAAAAAAVQGARGEYPVVREGGGGGGVQVDAATVSRHEVDDVYWRYKNQINKSDK